MTLGLSMAPPPIKVGGHCSSWLVFVSSQFWSWDEFRTSSDGPQKYGIITFFTLHCVGVIRQKLIIDMLTVLFMFEKVGCQQW